MKNDLEVGNRIRKLREDFKMNRDTFSENLDISENYLAQLERGEKPITLNVVYSVCAFTDCSADYLLYGNADEDNSKKKRLFRLINRSHEEDLDLYYDVLHSIRQHYKAHSDK